MRMQRATQNKHSCTHVLDTSQMRLDVDSAFVKSHRYKKYLFFYKIISDMLVYVTHATLKLILTFI